MKSLFLLLILILAVFTNSSLACSRFEFGAPVCAEFTRADAVFIGKAVKVENLTGKADYPNDWQRVYFKVEQNFKGAENPTFSFVTNDWRSACGLNIKRGQTWLIYAYYDDKDKTFISNNGYKYKPERDKEDVEILKAASERKTDAAISGRLISNLDYKYKYEPVEITVEGNGTRQIATIDADGAFRQAFLNPGNYKVRLAFPFYALHTSFIPDLKLTTLEETQTLLEYEVELRQGDCHYGFIEILKKSK